MKFTGLGIIGCGDIGFRVARLALASSVKVSALSRGGKLFPDEVKAGISIITADLDEPDSLLNITLKNSAVLYTAPPPGGGLIDTRVSHFLAAVGKGEEPEKIVYLSTTSVYGDCSGELVTEERAPQPVTHAGRRRLDAERQFLSWGAERQIPVVILRVSGIYGPGRIPMQRIIDREPLLCESEAGYTNRIHADDLAMVCMAALEKGESGDVFNVSDGEISKMTDYFNAITDLLQLPRLPQVPLAEARKIMSPLMFSYMIESRKISNKKMLTKLEVQLKYPTMQEGLKETVQQLR